MASDIWQNLGWGAIIFLAQLSRLDPQLYEAAVIDGASRFQQMRFISLPGLKSVISILLILRIGTLLSVGAEKVILMYLPATYETADVIGSFVYRRGLLHADFSYGAAVGLFGSVIGLILIICANRVAKKVSEFTVCSAVVRDSSLSGACSGSPSTSWSCSSWRSPCTRSCTSHRCR